MIDELMKVPLVDVRNDVLTRPVAVAIDPVESPPFPTGCQTTDAPCQVITG